MKLKDTFTIVVKNVEETSLSPYQIHNMAKAMGRQIYSNEQHHSNGYNVEYDENNKAITICVEPNSLEDYWEIFKDTRAMLQMLNNIGAPNNIHFIEFGSKDPQEAVFRCAA